ncbi:histone deacetylase family protein [Maritalea mediterranea]|uniref:Histone deacetylase family protein n=1 Tax=Maritalea mediterranea TaxID=2909667 RepID=A0ABS9E6N1_9HYPH|nr:histone deacetylase family protein [Maritalea mediterranea]MCF4097884.1 histone deacetylase family protein [Maritalea mediterranea]
MACLLIQHPQGAQHQMPKGHPENPDRLHYLDLLYAHERFADFDQNEAKYADLGLVSLAHSKEHIQLVKSRRPVESIAEIDGDTFIAANSFEAVMSGIGGAMDAVESVMQGHHQNGFCAIRPPGHHAERNRPMGFCLFNTIAITALWAREHYGMERIAIVDFDVHHGNGTQDILYDDRNMFYASSHEMPLFPGTGMTRETGAGNIYNVPLGPGGDGSAMREAYLDRLLPALDRFNPDFILLSAGFDADARDPLASLNWTPHDYAWITGKIMDIADKRCEGRIVSLLEGGYHLNALAEGVAAHINMLEHGEMGVPFDAAKELEGIWRERQQA